MSRQLNWIEISTRMLTNDEEHLVCRAFGRNRPIVSIDSYDGTVHRGLFRLSRDRRI